MASLLPFSAAFPSMRPRPRGPQRRAIPAAILSHLKLANAFKTMASLTVTFTPVAEAPDRRPSLPRSGACAAPLPAWHQHEAILLGGYTEAQHPGPVPPHREPTLEAWTFSFVDGGRWHAVKYAEGSPVPQPRLTAQAVVLGHELWLVGGWNPSAGPGGAPFLNDVWVLDLRTYRWSQVEVAGEEMPPISRFAMVALPGGRLVLHTHRSAEDVMVLEPSPSSEGAEGGKVAAAAPRRAILRRLPVHGVFPGAPSPPSRGLHSLTLAAAPPAATTAVHLNTSPTNDVPLAAAAADGLAAPSGTALYVYGGAPQSGPMYGDIWVLDLGSMTWRQLDPRGEPPQVRCSHVAGAVGDPSVHGGRYLMFMGGSFYAPSGGLQPLDDVVAYDTQTNRWMVPEVVGPRPSARNAAVLVPLRIGGSAAAMSVDAAGGAGAAGERFLLHGGWRPFVETYNDTFVVTVTSRDGVGKKA